MSRRSTPRKYDPLTAYLAGLTTTQVTLTLGEIEALISARLPGTASAPSFWQNSGGSWVAKAWLRAGWRMATVQPRPAVESVTFARVPT
jgi:hypothetical protein